MAQALGLHNDRSSCSLKPFDVQMRRRLWHCIWVLDIRSATDRGSEPIITEGLNETPLPANVCTSVSSLFTLMKPRGCFQAFPSISFEILSFGSLLPMLILQLD